MKFILGTKQYMTQIFDEKGIARAGTVIAATPNKVTALKTIDKDTYASVQIGFDAAKEKHVSKAVRGHLKATGLYKHLKEFRTTDSREIGSDIDVSAFVPGDIVEVSGVSKGKGFQGVVKRHGFSGGSRTHGQKHSEREPGSIGGGLRTHVPKGMRMAGRMGSDRITQKNLKVVFVDTESNSLLVKGALTGRKGTLVEIISR